MLNQAGPSSWKTLAQFFQLLQLQIQIKPHACAVHAEQGVQRDSTGANLRVLK